MLQPTTAYAGSSVSRFVLGIVVSMKILALAPDVPATSRMPGSPRLFSLCRELSRKHQIVLATFSSSEARYQTFANDPSTVGVFQRIEILPDAPPMTWWGQQRHRIHLAPYFETRFRYPDYHRSIRMRIKDLCSKEAIDLIHVDLVVMAQYVDPEWNWPAIIDLHDSLTLLGRRMLHSERGLRRRLAAYLNLVSVERSEQSLHRTFALALTNSTVDEGVIRGLSPSANTLTITNGVDMEFFAPDSRATESDRLVFTGVMGYGPNEDAAAYFCEEVFPLVRARRPQCEFWIVGSQPSARVEDLARLPGVHVTGEVDDVRPYVRSAGLFVSPLRVGSGVKNKILAALAMQKAVVATSLSIEGLDVRDDRELLVADRPDVFAHKVVHLLGNPAEAQRLAATGLARVRSKYSWAAMGHALESAIEAVLRSGPIRWNEGATVRRDGTICGE